MQAKSKYVSQLEDCKMLNSRPNSSGPCLGNSANRSCGVWLKNWLPSVALLHSSVVMSLSTTRKVMSSNLGGGTFSNRRQSSKQRYTSQNSDKRAYFLPAFRAQNADIWRNSDRKVEMRRYRDRKRKFTSLLCSILSLYPSMSVPVILPSSLSSFSVRTSLWAD